MDLKCVLMCVHSNCVRDMLVDFMLHNIIIIINKYRDMYNIYMIYMYILHVRTTSVQSMTVSQCDLPRP